jgi:L-ascorbate metabolism protein UlaG (beta-lactamase superfamily)
MKITLLGHQGWRFTNGGRSFLLDPILEEIGNGRERLPVWPARRLDLAKLGPIDAVVVSHEHNDHFSLDTLAALPATCASIARASPSCARRRRRAVPERARKTGEPQR